MSWYSDPWTQDDSVLDGLPYPSYPANRYSIDAVRVLWASNESFFNGLPYVTEPTSSFNYEDMRFVWMWSQTVLNGLPFTTASVPQYSMEDVRFVWNWSPFILDNLPYTNWLPVVQAYENVWDVKIRGFYSYRTLTKITHDEESETCEIP